MAHFENPRNRQLREFQRLAKLAERDKIERVFAELEARTNPAIGPGPDEDPDQYLFPFADYVSDR